MPMVLMPVIFRLMIGAEFSLCCRTPASALLQDIPQTLRILPAIPIVRCDLDILMTGYAQAQFNGARYLLLLENPFIHDRLVAAQLF
jgi:hypothetical protein